MLLKEFLEICRVFAICVCGMTPTQRFKISLTLILLAIVLIYFRRFLRQMSLRYSTKVGIILHSASIVVQIKYSNSSRYLFGYQWYHVEYCIASIFCA